jgi:hypothetical protein
MYINDKVFCLFILIVYHLLSTRYNRSAYSTDQHAYVMLIYTETTRSFEHYDLSIGTRFLEIEIGSNAYQ